MIACWKENVPTVKFDGKISPSLLSFSLRAAPAQLHIPNLQGFLTFQSFYLFYPFSLPSKDLPLILIWTSFPLGFWVVIILRFIPSTVFLCSIYYILSHFSPFLIYLLILLEVTFLSHQISERFCISPIYFFDSLAVNSIHFKLLFFQDFKWAMPLMPVCFLEPYWWPIFLSEGI